jgi:hypothetical protein
MYKTYQIRLWQTIIFHTGKTDRLTGKNTWQLHFYTEFYSLLTEDVNKLELITSIVRSPHKEIEHVYC